MIRAGRSARSNSAPGSSISMPDETAQGVLTRSDAAMYEAKGSRRMPLP